MTNPPSDDQFIEAFNAGGARHVVNKYGGDAVTHRVRAAKLRKKGHQLTKFKAGRPQKGNHESV